MVGGNGLPAFLRPAWHLTVSATFAFAVTCVLAYTTWTTYHAFRRLADEDLVLLKTMGTIVHLDELLTMSARMAAATGDQRWSDRYQEGEKRLRTAIETARSLVPAADGLEFILATDKANRRLVELERQGLQLVAEGRADQAMDRVFNEEYEQLKEEYLQGTLNSLRVCDERVAEKLVLHRRATLANGALALSGALGGFGFLAAYLRSVGRRHKLRHELQVVMRRSTLGELAGTLAHELNQPLAAIVNYCAAAERLMRDQGMQERPIEAVARAQQQAQRAGQIIEKIRSFVREDGPTLLPTELTSVVRDALTLVQVEAPLAGVALRTQIKGPIWVLGDAVQLEQVLVNLLMNAIDASASGGNGQVVLVARATPEEAILDFRDNGPGVARGHEKHIFEAFHSTKPNGLGLGLSISRAIVENHSGQLSHERVDGWTIFRVRLPRTTLTE